MSLSRRTRFQVLKRDGFTCQYCGANGEGVVLHVDHIHPRSKGGGDELDNLITACIACNLGKTDSKLLEVTPCAFCGDEGAGFAFDLPLVNLGRYTGTSETGWVCGDCIQGAVRAFRYALNPDVLRCAGCGDFWELIDSRQFNSGDFVAGEVAWVCPPCFLEDEFFGDHEPPVRRWEPKKR